MSGESHFASLQLNLLEKRCQSLISCHGGSLDWSCADLCDVQGCVFSAKARPFGMVQGDVREPETALMFTVRVGGVPAAWRALLHPYAIKISSVQASCPSSLLLGRYKYETTLEIARWCLKNKVHLVR